MIKVRRKAIQKGSTPRKRKESKIFFNMKRWEKQWSNRPMGKKKQASMAERTKPPTNQPMKKLEKKQTKETGSRWNARYPK